MAITVTQWSQTTDWTTDSASKTVTVSWAADDVIVVAWAVSSGNVSPSAPTATGLTFTQRQYTNLSAGECEVAFYTAKAAAQGTNVDITVTYDTVTGSDGWGFCVWVLNGADDYVTGFINQNESATNLTVGSGSAVCYIVADWTAAATGDGTLSMTTGSGAASERRDDGTTTTMNCLVGDWVGTSAGTFSFGLANYSPGGNALAVCQAAIEVSQFIVATEPDQAFIDATYPMNGGVELFWQPPADNGSAITSYEVDWATAAAPTTWLGPVSVSASARDYKKTGLTNGTGYVFRLRAVNAIGPGPWSASSVTTTPTDLPVSFMAVASAITASRSPSVTFNHRPQENDVVVLFPSSTGTGVVYTIPSGWENPLGGTTDVESDSHQMGVVAHRVTAGEETADTVTFTTTNLTSVIQSGNVIGIVVRNVDTTTMVDVAGSTFSSTNTVTPHVLAATAAANATDSLILRCVTKDTTGTYTTPAGHTQILTSNTNQGKWLGTRDTRTTSGATIAAVNITPSAGDEYTSVTVALRKAVSSGANWDGAVGTAQVSGIAGSFSATGTASWTGAVGNAQTTGVNGAITGEGTATWSGAVGTAQVTGIEGTLSPTGSAPITGSVGTAQLVGIDGSFSASGTASWTGAVGSAQVVGIDGSLAGAGTASLAGSVGTAQVTGVEGAFEAAGSPQSWTGSVATVTLSGIAGSIDGTGTATLNGSVGTAQLIGVDGSLSATGTASWAGAFGTVQLTGVAGSFSATGTASIAGSVGSAQVTGVEGSFAAGASQWTGSVGDVTLSGVTGSLSPTGTASWDGSAGTAQITGVSGSFSATGGASWTGAVGSIQVSGQEGTLAGTGTASLAGTAGTVTLEGQAGALTATGGASWDGAVGTIGVTGDEGTFNAGAGGWAGSTGTVQVQGVSGAFGATGTSTWSGSVSNAQVVGQEGSLGGTGTATVGGSVALVRVDPQPGSFSGVGIATLNGSTGSVQVTGQQGSFSATGTGSINGSVGTAQVAGIAGAFSGSGSASWSGSVAAITLQGVAGVLAIALQIIGVKTLARVDGERTIERVDSERSMIRDDSERTIERADEARTLLRSDASRTLDKTD